MDAMLANLDEQWAEYRRRRRSFWKTLFSSFLFFIPFGIIALIRPGWRDNLPAPVGVVLLLCTVAWFTLYVRAWYRLLKWPCPCCGKPFIHAWFAGSWPTDTCKHCGARLSSVQPSGPTNRSQPVGSETDRTSPAAGSRRWR